MSCPGGARTPKPLKTNGCEGVQGSRAPGAVHIHMFRGARVRGPGCRRAAVGFAALQMPGGRCRFRALLCPNFGWAISHIKNFGSSSKHTEICPESGGIVVCMFVGTVPDIWGLFWPSFRPKSGSKSKISGWILIYFRGPF